MYHLYRFREDANDGCRARTHGIDAQHALFQARIIIPEGAADAVNHRSDLIDRLRPNGVSRGSQPRRELEDFCRDLLIKFNEDHFALRVGNESLPDVGNLPVIQPGDDLFAHAGLDRKSNRGIRHATQNRHSLMPLHLAAAGILILVDLLDESALAKNNANPFRTQSLEAGKGRKIRACLAADFWDFEGSVIVIGDDGRLRIR